MVAVFVWLGMLPLPAGDAWCSRVAVAAWCCGWCRCAARWAARSCQGLCGVPVPDGAQAAVVPVALVACGRFGAWGVAWGVEVVGLGGALVPDGAGARTLVALVAAVVHWVVVEASLRVEVEELWWWAAPAVIRAAAALLYVPGSGNGTSGWRARRATGRGLWGRGIPLHVR